MLAVSLRHEHTGLRLHHEVDSVCEEPSSQTVQDAA